MELSDEMNRKKKIKIVQISLFLLGIFIIYSTYYGEKLNSGSYLFELRRVNIGDYSVLNALKIE